MARTQSDPNARLFEMLADVQRRLRALETRATGGGGIPASLIDAAGDLIYGSAADTAARRAIGDAGDVLTVDSGLPEWAPPGETEAFTPVIEVGGGGQTITVGNGTIVGRKREYAGWLDLYVSLTFGSTTAGGSGWPGGGAFTGLVFVNLPSGLLARATGMVIGTALLNNFGAAVYAPTPAIIGSDLTRFNLWGDSNAYSLQHNTPFTPTAGDSWEVSCRLELFSS